MFQKILAGSYPTLGGVSLENVGSDPPTTGGGDTIDTLYVNEVPILRDRDGVQHPLVVGADGAGIVEVAFADSPYDVAELDRVALVDTTGGAVTLTLPADGGPSLGRPLYVADAASNFGTNACTINGNGKTINGAATLVLNLDNASAFLLWNGTEWSLIASSSGAATPFDPASPGTLGGTTPGTVNASSLYLTGTSAAAVANKTQLIRTTTGFQAVSAGGAKQTYNVAASSGTASVVRYMAAVTIANDSQHTVAIAGGGFFRVSKVGATSSVFAAGAFAANAATTFNGVTYTGCTVTIGTPASLNIGADAGSLAFENKTGSSGNFLIEVDQLAAV